ncbi:MAG: hypothetical protein EHM20_10880 [Alphaproteobacteria bacterium]|nr:MAG: hypothetical protein EHM20_10880 [Alphaproteobacteria bacterium]
MSEIKKATKRLIDSVWTVTYKLLENGKVEILGYNREDREGYEKEGKLPMCRILEEEKGRIAKELLLMPYESHTFCNESNCTERYVIENQKNIFSYS